MGGSGRAEAVEGRQPCPRAHSCPHCKAQWDDGAVLCAAPLAVSTGHALAHLEVQPEWTSSSTLRMPQTRQSMSPTVMEKPSHLVGPSSTPHPTCSWLFSPSCLSVEAPGLGCLLRLIEKCHHALKDPKCHYQPSSALQTPQPHTAITSSLN